MSGFFVTGGTMKPDALSYIEREADDELYRKALAGEYCNVLAPRQLGKSSLMARTAARFRAEGIACVTVDLQGKGDVNPPPEQWYYGFVTQIAAGLRLRSGLAMWWKQQKNLMPAQRVTDFLAEIVLKQIIGRVVVFVDEVDWIIRLPFSDEFFAAIRSCFNRRATDPRFGRLTFVLLGTAAPAQLIKDPTRTPFNIGRSIELSDFTPQTARPLATQLGDEGERLLTRILYWTDGHPYLTQILCAKVSECDHRVGMPEGIVDAAVQENLLSVGSREGENNLKFVADRLSNGGQDRRRVLHSYRDILLGKNIKNIPISPIHAALRLSGVVKPDNKGFLRVRNLIYREVFSDAWVHEKMPSDSARKIWVAMVLVASGAAIFSLWYFVMFPVPLVRVLETAGNDIQVVYDAYDALNKPFHRAKAHDLLAQFWERRGDRDRSLLVRASIGETAKVDGLIGTDYPLLRRTFRQLNPVFAVVFSSDGKLVGTGSGDNTARVFNMTSGREISRFVHQGAVRAIAFSTDGKHFATTSDDQTARVFELSDNREISHFALRGGVRAVAFSPNGMLLATAFSGGAAQVFEVRTGREVWRLRLQQSVDAIALSPDGRFVASDAGDHTTRVFEVLTGREIFDRTHEGDVKAVAFSPDGKMIASAEDRAVRVIEIETGREVSYLLHQDEVYAASFSPNGRLLATASEDRTARVFEVSTSREICRLSHEGRVLSVAFSPGGNLVATGSADGTTRVFEAAADRQFSRLVHEGQVGSVAFSPDRKLMLTVTDSVKARILEVENNHEVMQFKDKDGIFEASFSPDGKLVATASRSCARVIEVATGREVSKFALGNPVDAVAFNSDGKLVAAGTFDGSVQIFDQVTSKQLLGLNMGRSVSAIAFSPDGTLLALSSIGHELVFLETATGNERSHLARINRPERGIAFSLDGTLLVTESGDWLRLYQRDGTLWYPVANRHIPVLWPNTVRFVQSDANCRRCVEVVRDVPENLLKLDRINFDEYPPVAPQDPRSLVEQWSPRLGLTIDSRGHITP